MKWKNLIISKKTTSNSNHETSISVLKLKSKIASHFYFVSDSSKVINLLFFSHDSSQIFIYKRFWPYFFTEWMVYFSKMIWWIYFPEIHPVSEFFRIFPDFSGFFRIFRIFFKSSNFVILFRDYVIYRLHVSLIYYMIDFSGIYLFSGFFWVFLKSIFLLLEQ